MKAFDEVMKLNDGGISYLAANLSEVCRPGMKLDQIRVRLQDSAARSCRAACTKIRAYRSRQAAGRTGADRGPDPGEFEACLQKNAFGTFLRGLCVERGGLADALHEPSQSFQPEVPAKEPSKLISMVKANGSSSGKIASAPSPSRLERLARTSMQVWTSTFMNSPATKSSQAGSVFRKLTPRDSE